MSSANSSGRIIIKLWADTIFINIGIYSGYLLRFKGNIEEAAFAPYNHLWLHITLAYLIVFSLLKAYRDPQELSNREIFVNIFNATTIAGLTSMSIVYTMRNIYGFMPSSVFVFAWFFNIILLSGWRLLIRYET